MSARAPAPQPPHAGADPLREMAQYPTPQARPEPTLMRLTLLSLGGSLLAWAGTYIGGRIPPTNPSRQGLVTALTVYAPAVAWAAGIAGVVLALATLASRRFRARRAQLRNTIAYAMRQHPERLRVKAKWDGGYLSWARVRYPRRVPVTVDPDEAFLKAIGRQMKGQPQATAEHDPRARTVTFVPTPPAPEELPDWWHVQGYADEVVKRLDALRDNLKGFLGEAHLDQERTEIGSFGQISKVTAIYPSTTTRDTSDQFLIRVRRVLAQKVPSPTGSWSLTWIPHEGEVIITPSVEMPERVLNPGLPTDREHPHMLPVGVRRTGDPAFWCPHRYPHLLLSGMTGGGKSVVIRTLVIMALMARWDLYLCDAKKVGYRRSFATGWGMSHERIATTGRHMESVILAIYNEMMRRYQRIEWGDARLEDFTPLLLIVDENTEALAIMANWAKRAHEHRTNKPAPRSLKSDAEAAEWSIARLGREVGVYIVLAHQRPDTSYIPGEARDNLVSALAAGPLSPHGLKMLFDSYGVEQQVFKRVQLDDGSYDVVPVQGRATANLGRGPEPVQGYWTPKPGEGISDEEHAQLEWLRSHCQAAQEAAAHPLLPGVVTPSPDDSDDPAEDGPSQPSQSELRHQQASHAAHDHPRDDTGSQDSAPQSAGGGAQPTTGEMVLVTDLQEGDQVWLDLDAEDTEVEVLGLLDGAPGEIELEYRIVQADHPEESAEQTIALDERSWLTRVDESGT